MNRIHAAFAGAQDQNRGALIIYLTAGAPSLAATADIAVELAERGADLIELGLPFSDSLADGPVIQGAANQAIASGTTPDGVLECAGRIRARCDVPLVLMTAYNPVYCFQPPVFAREAAAQGVDGVLISDLPPSEAGDWAALAAENALGTVFLVAPTTPRDRVALIAELCTGFVYCVSVTGVTGAREELPPDLPEVMARVRAATDRPVAVGFGISKPEQVQAVCGLADGAIVGSAVVQRITDLSEDPALVTKIGDFVADLARGTRRSNP